DLYDEFERTKLGAGEFNADTAQGYRATIRELTECLGDLNPDSFSPADIVRLRETWQKLPSNRHKSPKYRERSLDELLTMDIPKADLRSARTVLEALGRVKSFFR